MRSTRAVATSSQAVSELFNLGNQDNTRIRNRKSESEIEIGNRKSKEPLLEVADDVQDEVDGARGHSAEDRELRLHRKTRRGVVGAGLMRAEVHRRGQWDRSPGRMHGQVTGGGRIRDSHV